MAALIVDSPPTPPDAQAPDPAAAPGAPVDGPPPAGAAAGTAPTGSVPPAAAELHTCPRCGASMAAGQDWCLQCGAGTRGSVGTPSWRSAAVILGATGVLVLGAAGAGYAALSKPAKKVTAVVVRTGQSASTAAAPPSTATTPVSPPAVPKTLGTPTTIKPAIPLTATKTPKIPLTATTPAATTPAATTPAATTPAATGGASASEEASSSAILLDTNAASTYNPYSYPASTFGDPSLTIDGDTSTGWTAQVNPASAPSMAVGVLISLHSKQKVGSLELVSSTPGMSVQIYGSTAATVPTSITDPAWTPLSGYLVVKKRHARIHLRDATKAFAFITLWISKAPASSIGTAEAPGHVSVNEIELFAPAG